LRGRIGTGERGTLPGDANAALPEEEGKGGTYRAAMGRPGRDGSREKEGRNLENGERHAEKEKEPMKPRSLKIKAKL